MRALEATQNAGTSTQGTGTQSSGRRGIAASGQTSIFDNTFNPAISLIGDFTFAGSDRSDSFEDLNRFNLRSAEWGIVGRVDPIMSYQVYVHFDEEEVELEEAFGTVDNWLPDTLQLKFGRFNSDFGKLSAAHDHDLPFLDKPQVLQEYLGGSLRGTGIELHHWAPLGDTSLLRWSLGAANGLDGDGHPIFGPGAGAHHHDDEEEGAEPFGTRDAGDFAFTGRVSTLFEIGQESTIQVGASAAWAPEAKSFFEVGIPPNTEVIRTNLQTLILGTDVTFKHLDPATGRGFNLGAELLQAKNEFSDDGATITDEDSVGYYAYAEFLANPTWSFGASAGHYEHAEDSSERSWDAGAFATYRVNDFNRLRLEARHFDDPDEDYFGIALQWTVILGSHGHGIDW